MGRPVGSTLPTYDRLDEALLGLCVLATRETFMSDELRRLVAQFRENYPDLILLEPGDVLRTARKEVAV